MFGPTRAKTACVRELILILQQEENDFLEADKSANFAVSAVTRKPEEMPHKMLLRAVWELNSG